MPCGIDTGDPQGIRAHDAGFYWQDSAVSGTDSDDEASRAGKRADRGFEDNHKAFSDFDFDTNTGIWKRSHCSRQSSSTLDHRLQLRHEPLPTVWRWLAVSLFSSLGQLSKRDKKLFILGELAASLQGASIEETGANTHLCNPGLAIRYIASLFWPFTILAS